MWKLVLGPVGVSSCSWGSSKASRRCSGSSCLRVSTLSLARLLRLLLGSAALIGRAVRGNGGGSCDVQCHRALSPSKMSTATAQWVFQ
eukprot:7803047-Pyramimonas_sp.AAC.1